MTINETIIALDRNAGKFVLLSKGGDGTINSFTRVCKRDGMDYLRLAKSVDIKIGKIARVAVILLEDGTEYIMLF